MNKKIIQIKANRILFIITFTSVALLAAIQPDHANFELSRVLPDKIITPNGDGINDEVNFIFANPKESIVSGCVYDITGALVADLVWSGDNSSLKWDGRDKNSNVVREGIYIYQIRAEGKAVNGIVIVLK